jgi:hypothetical protein
MVIHTHIFSSCHPQLFYSFHQEPNHSLKLPITTNIGDLQPTSNLSIQRRCAVSFTLSDRWWCIFNFTLYPLYHHCSGYKPHSRVLFLAATETFLFTRASRVDLQPTKCYQTHISWAWSGHSVKLTTQTHMYVCWQYHRTSISSYTFMAQYISREKFTSYPGLNTSCLAHINWVSVLQCYRPVTYNFHF